MTIGQINAMKEEVRALLLNPDIAVVGHNLKYDLHCLRSIGIDVVPNWYADTMQLAFAVDENMLNKSLTECTRRWVPSLSGYSDAFDDETDKSKMHLVPHDKMLDYAAGDVDATYRLAKALLPLAKEDTRNWNTFLKVQMPSLRAFVEMEENGVLIDREELARLQEELAVLERESYEELIAMVPPAVLRRHEGGWSFSRQAFTVDVLFSKDGLGLKPLVFTKATKNLPPTERIPSTSAKDHLPFFDDNPFVQKLMSYQKLTKMRGTYVGEETRTEWRPVNRTATGAVPVRIASILRVNGIELPPCKALRPRVPVLPAPVSINLPDGRQIMVNRVGQIQECITTEPTGFWQYLQGSDRIHPSFLLHGTVTGRSSSRNPNAQNFPKRGALAKLFRKIFKASPGYVFLEADLSQAEIRVAGWMAEDQELIKVYQEGGDVHSLTASITMGVSIEKFNAGRRSEAKLFECANEWPGSGSWLQTYGNNERLELTVAQFCDFKRFQAKALWPRLCGELGYAFRHACPYS